MLVGVHHVGLDCAAPAAIIRFSAAKKIGRKVSMVKASLNLSTYV